jgi:hypothetical protein
MRAENPSLSLSIEIDRFAAHLLATPTDLVGV